MYEIHTSNWGGVVVGNFLSGSLGLVGALLFFGYGIAQIVAASFGFELWVGGVWSWVIVVACMFFRFTLPITVGAFFGAYEGWGWHWAAALVFAVPGLLLVVPGILGTIMTRLRGLAR